MLLYAIEELSARLCRAFGCVCACVWASVFFYSSLLVTLLFCVFFCLAVCASSSSVILVLYKTDLPYSTVHRKTVQINIRSSKLWALWIWWMFEPQNHIQNWLSLFLEREGGKRSNLRGIQKWVWEWNETPPRDSILVDSLVSYELVFAKCFMFRITERQRFATLSPISPTRNF